jgi:hypothetical protein
LSLNIQCCRMLLPASSYRLLHIAAVRFITCRRRLAFFRVHVGCESDILGWLDVAATDWCFRLLYAQASEKKSVLRFSANPPYERGRTKCRAAVSGRSLLYSLTQTANMIDMTLIARTCTWAVSAANCVVRSVTSCIQRRTPINSGWWTVAWRDVPCPCPGGQWYSGRQTVEIRGAACAEFSSAISC